MFRALRTRPAADFMGDKLERIFELRVLSAKQRELHVPLTHGEKARLLKLQQDLPDRVPAVDEHDPFTVLPAALHAQYVVSGRFGAGVLRNASAAGLAIATDEEPPPLGQRLILHASDPEHGVEYTFPCRVVARVVKPPAAMGVRFEGMPSQTRMGRQSGSVWRSGIVTPEAETRVSARPPPVSKRESG